MWYKYTEEYLNASAMACKSSLEVIGRWTWMEVAAAVCSNWSVWISVYLSDANANLSVVDSLKGIARHMCIGEVVIVISGRNQAIT